MSDSGTSVLQVRYAERRLQVRDAFPELDDDGELWMDYSYWVVRRGDAIALVDTGYDVDSGEWLGEQGVLPPLDGLALLGINPADVGLVVLTHYHFDHVGFVDAFPNARVVAARVEHDFWMHKLDTDALAGEFGDPAMLRAIRAVEGDGRLELIEADTTVAPGITARVVGGHCPGQLVVEVSTDDGLVVLAADAAHYGVQIERDLPFFTYTDRDEMFQALQLLRERSHEDGVRVVPGHDPAVRALYPDGHPDVPGIVTVLA